MKRLLLILFCLEILIPYSTSQIISKDLKVILDNFEIEVLKTKVCDIKSYFDKDSLIDIEFEGTYVLMDNEVELFFCDKNNDEIVDIITIYSKRFKTWNNIRIGADFKALKEQFGKGKFGVNNDFANLIVYSFSPNGDQNVSLDFYIETNKKKWLTNDELAYSDELSQKEYEIIVQEDSKLIRIEIINPK